MYADEVQDQAGFIHFLAQMRTELAGGAENWANVDLADFLECMGAWIVDQRSDADGNPWRHAAQLLRAGAFYQ